MNKKPQHAIKSQLSPYNIAVKQAYFNILKVAKSLLTPIEHEELRYTLVRDERNRTTTGAIIHEFVNPLLYLRLECQSDNLFAIHYGHEQITKQVEYSDITGMFTRCIYRLTSKEVTQIDIEASVKTDWLIETPSAMYEYLEEQNKYHLFTLIKHKVTASQRKRLLSVA